jgi:hypothetical protein
MPIAASALETDSYLRMLVLSWPKKGATTHVIATSPKPVRVLLCERTDTALQGAKRETDQFDFERVTGFDSMAKFIVEAKKDAKERLIKTVVVDPLNFFADRLMEECVKATVSKEGNEDGRRAHPEFTRRIKHIINLLQTIPAHLIVVNHYMEVGGDDATDKPKNGPGIVPLMPNMASRSAVAAMFHDVVWFDYAPKDAASYNNRVFFVGGDGVWGPGCRSLTKNTPLPAHVGDFIKTIAEQNKTEKSNGAGAVKPKPPVVRPQPTVRR